MLNHNLLRISLFIIPCRCIASSFKYADLTIQECKVKKKLPTKVQGFGKLFTDHMLRVDWDQHDGWGSPKILEFGPISLSPAIKALHYATAAFEGLKVVKGIDGRSRIFRPEKHLERFLSSSKRVALPEFSTSELFNCIKTLIRLDKRWIPDGEGETLYVRPLIFGDDPSLGVDVSTQAMIIIMLSPAGVYFHRDDAGVSVYADPRFVRSWEGGSGANKLSANYAPTLNVQQIVHEKGCHTTLWLYGPNEAITEAGTMNIFILWINEEGEKELITPPLNGLILPGVTRDSVLNIVRDWKEFKVSEQNITMSQLITALEEHRILHMFGTGTACVISPISELLYREKRFKIPGTIGPECVPERIKKEYKDIQTGIQSPHPWTHEID